MHIDWFAVALFVHVVAFAVGFGAVVVVDTAGLLWLTGKREFGLGRVSRVADVTQPLIWVGFVTLILSGVYMQLDIGHADATSWIKFGLVAALGGNGVVLHHLKRVLGRFPDDAGLQDVKAYMPAMFISTTVSQIGWWGAALIGFAHAYTRNAVASPVSPLAALLSLYGVWAAACAVSYIYERKARTL